VADALSRS
jgi:Integrase zinc binding domain